VLEISKELNLLKKIHPKFPYIEGEVVYAIRHEMALKPNDFVCRRIRLAFIDESLAVEILPRVVELMAVTLGWSEKEKEQNLQKAITNIRAKQ